jgi:anaerobic selenocysteine-containing dehydrogenase
MREEIARVVPFYNGCQNLRKSGDGFQYGGAHLCAGGTFPTSDGKAHFRPVPLPDQIRQPDEFRVSTRRGKQFNTIVYAEIDPLNGAARDAVLMNPEDAAALHLMDGDPVVLANSQGRMEGHVHLAPLARGNLQVHWPEGNVLIRPGVLDPAGGVPDYNAIVRVEAPNG